jgi:hypothetical protein
MKIKRLLKNDHGFALPAALVLMFIGTLFIVPTTHLAQTSLISSLAIEESNRNVYAASAGIEYAYWRIKNDASISFPTAGQAISLPFSDTVNGRTPSVTLENLDGTTFRITSTSNGTSSSITITSDIDLTFSSGGTIFDNALTGLSGNIEFGGNTLVNSDTPLAADIYAGGSPGNIVLYGGCYVDGDAHAVGTITKDPNSTIAGNQYPGSPSLSPPPGIDTWAENCKLQTMDVDCPATTRSGNWAITGTGNLTYSNAEHITGNLSISRTGTVTFTNTVCVDGNLTISGSATVVFLGPVKIGGYTLIDNTFYTDSYFETKKNAVIRVGDVMYVNSYITMAKNYDAAFKKYYLYNESPILANGDIHITGNAITHTNNAEDLPIIVSVNGNIYFWGSRWVEAVMYAIRGSLSLSNNGLLCGCAIGTVSLTTGNSSRIYYLAGIGGRGDLPGGEGGTGQTVTSVEIRTYTIQ